MDDNNEPAPKNVPQEAATNTNYNLDEGQTCGWIGFDDPKVMRIPNVNSSLKGLSSLVLEGTSYAEMFKLLFLSSIMFTILKETNNVLDDVPPLSYGEMLCFFGIILFMSTISEFNWSDFWSSVPVSMKTGAPYRFHEWMSMYMFETTFNNLGLAQDKPPKYKDPFWEFHEMVKL